MKYFRKILLQWLKALSLQCMFRNLFPKMNDKEIGIEKTPSYFDCSDPDIAKRIRESVPGIKLLLIVCNPTARAFSDYTHQVKAYI